MSSAFPLVRAAVLVPFVDWMQRHGRPVDAALWSADLNSGSWETPNDPIALVSALRFLRALARKEGPDIGFRVVSEASIAQLAGIGSVMLGADTLREALTLTAAAMPRHSTHEILTVSRTSGGVLIREQLMLDLDHETRHVEQQYVLGLIRALCRATGYRGEPLERVEMVPHPQAGLDQLRGTLDANIAPSRSRGLSMFVPDVVLDRPFLPRAPAAPPDNWQVLRGDGAFASTARVFVGQMLDDGEPSLGRLVAASGLSRRTLQRRLAADETSYSDLLDEVRRERAIQDIVQSSDPMGQIAANLGYSGQAALVRAVRRWTDRPPRQVRRSAKVGQPGVMALAGRGEERRSAPLALSEPRESGS